VSLAALAQYGSLNQSADGTLLDEVSLGSAYVSEALRASWRLSPAKALHAELATNVFKSDTGSLAPSRSVRATLAYHRPWGGLGRRFEWGAVALLDDRFTKASANTLRLERGISLGARLAWDTAIGDLGESGTRITLTLPVSGAVGSGILGGPWGPRLEITRRMRIGTGGGFLPRFLAFDAGAEWFIWKDPEGTRVTRWLARIGPEWVLE
jgi:hypothetical protein